MLKPTNDPLMVMKRREAQAAKETRESLGAAGTQPFQTVRKLQQQIDDLTAFVNAIPQIESGQVDKTGWTINTPPEVGPWKTVASVTVPRPAGRTRAVVQGIVNASGVEDLDQFGNYAMQGRILIGGAGSRTFVGTLETGANTVRSSLSMSNIRDFTTSATNITVTVQLRGRYHSYSSSNVASLSVQASFTQL